MFDEEKIEADRIDDEMLAVNGVAIDIESGSDGANGEFLDEFNNKMIGMHCIVQYVNNLNKKVNAFTDAINQVLVNNSTNQRGFTSYGLRINGDNPLFSGFSGCSNVKDLNRLLNKFQQNKSLVINELIRGTIIHNKNVLVKLVEVSAKRKVMGVHLINFVNNKSVTQVKKVVKRVSEAGAIGGATYAASSIVSNLGSAAIPAEIASTTFDVLGANGEVIASFVDGALAESAEVAAVASGSTELAVMGGTELAVVGDVVTTGATDLAVSGGTGLTLTGGGEVAATAGATASSGLFASALSIAGLSVAGAALVLAPLAYRVVKQTKNNMKNLEKTVNTLNNSLDNFYNSFYCNSIEYPVLKYDDSNTEGTMVFRSELLTSASNDLNIFLNNETEIPRACTLICGYLNGYETAMNEIVQNFKNSVTDEASFQSILNYGNNIIGNISKAIQSFLELEKENKTSIDIDSMALKVINGDYGNGLERRQKLGSNYEVIQKRVNELLLGTSVAATGAYVTTNTTNSTIVKKVVENSTDSSEKVSINPSKITDNYEKIKNQQEIEEKKKQQQETEEKKKQQQEAEEKKKQQQETEEKRKQQEAEEKKKQQDKVLIDDDNIENKVLNVKKDSQQNGNNVKSNYSSNNSSNSNNLGQMDNSSVSNQNLSNDGLIKDTPNYVKKPTITTTNVVKQTNSKSGSVHVAPVILGVAAVGGAAVLGTRFVKNKKDKEIYSDDEIDFSSTNEFSNVEVNDKDNKKNKSGSINDLVLDDVSSIKTEESIKKENTLDFE